jgi:hypothetical protein
MLSSTEMMPRSTMSRITKRHGARMTLSKKHDTEPVMPQLAPANLKIGFVEAVT